MEAIIARCFSKGKKAHNFSLNPVETDRLEPSEAHSIFRCSPRNGAIVRPPRPVCNSRNLPAACRSGLLHDGQRNHTNFDVTPAILGGAVAESDDVLEEGQFYLNLTRCETRVGTRRVHLTPTEFHLLACLLSHQGRVLSREELLKLVWGEDQQVTPRAVDTHLQRLRGKLGRARKAIQTVRGQGYRLVVRPGSLK